MTITTEEAEALAGRVEDQCDSAETAHQFEAAAMIRALAAERDHLLDRAESAEAGSLSKVPVGEWQDCLEPIIARFEVTGALGEDFTAVHNSKGSAALGKLFRRMSRTLDAAVDALTRAERAEAEAERLREDCDRMKRSRDRYREEWQRAKDHQEVAASNARAALEGGDNADQQI